MRILHLRSIALVALLLASGSAFGQCSGGSCGVRSSGQFGRFAQPQFVAPVQYVQPAAVVTYEWRQAEEAPSQHMLLRNGECVGGWCDSAQHFRSYSRGTWGPATDRAPITPPKGYGAKRTKHAVSLVGDDDPPQEMPPTGVDPSKLAVREKWTLSGREIDGPTAMALLQKSFESGGLSDDTSKRHLTLIARDAEGAKTARKALADLGAEALKDFRVQVYDLSRTVDQVMLAPFKMDADERFKKTGFVAIVQEPADVSGKGRVLVGVYEPSKLAEAVRNPDPNWDPNKTPTPKTPTPPAPIPPGPTPPAPVPPAPITPDSAPVSPNAIGMLGAAIAALLMLFRR